MGEEAVESLRFGVLLTFLSATLLVGILAFLIARSYSGKFFDSAAEQQSEMEVVGLLSLSQTSSKDMPVASLFTIVAREWRGISSISVLDKNGDLIVRGIPGKWEVSSGELCNTRADGFSFVSTADTIMSLKTSAGDMISYVSGPEQILYAKAPDVRSDMLEGRAYVTVLKDEATKTFHIEVRRMQ